MGNRLPPVGERGVSWGVSHTQRSAPPSRSQTLNPQKLVVFLRFSKRPRNPLRTLGWSTFENLWFFAIFRTLGWSTFENSWFFAIFKTPARPSADFGLVDLRKLVVFLRFSNCPRDPLRTLGWSTFGNSWFFPIFKSPARPTADFGLVDLRKLVVFCDFQFARAILCGVARG